MNTYSKFCPNVFVAQCETKHEKGSTIEMQTKYGNVHDAIVFNFLYEKEGFFYYSIVRADGFNVQEWAKRKADKLKTAALNADKKSTDYWNASNKDSAFLSLGEPIKIGHHSERGHRKIIEQAQNNMSKCVQESKKSEEYENRAEYYEHKAETINLSMPESLEYFEYQLELAKTKHQALKSGEKKQSHSYSLTYAKKAVNELTKKVELANRLWGEVDHLG